MSQNKLPCDSQLAKFFKDWQQIKIQQLKAIHQDTLDLGLQQFFNEYKKLRLLVDEKIQETKIVWTDERSIELQLFFNQLQPALVLFSNIKRQGSAINVWTESGLRRDEVRNCKVLCWLFDCQGSHGQGNAILSAFLDQLGIINAAFPRSENTTKSYWANIESCPLGEKESRVDIEIDGESFLLFIEVKIDAGETSDQLDRYLSIGKAKAANRPWGIIYLTRHGKLPARFIGKDQPLVPATWNQVIFAIEQHCKSLPDCFARTAISQFSKHVRTF